MAFSAFTLAETAAKALLRQAFFRKMKDNFDDHNSRIVQVEGGFRVSDHFNHEPGIGTDQIPDQWLDNSGASRVVSYPAFSVMRIASGAAQTIGIVSKRTVSFNGVILPIEFKARLKRGNDLAFTIGMQTNGSPGVYMERVDASNWRFVSFDTAVNNGTAFANVATGTWFEVRIVFTNDPSNRALCYLDGVLKETLTSQLPLTQALSAKLKETATAASQNFDFDRVDFSAGGGMDAA